MSEKQWEFIYTNPNGVSKSLVSACEQDPSLEDVAKIVVNELLKEGLVTLVDLERHKKKDRLQALLLTNGYTITKIAEVVA